MKKILIIDDNERVCKSLERNFLYTGWECAYALNGGQAMSLLDSFTPDAIILDLALGNENGIDILNLIRKQHKNLPIIMITGYGTIETAVEAIKLGAFDYLRKPVDFSILSEKVDRAVESYSIPVSKDISHHTLSKVEKTAIFKSEKMTQIYQKANALASESFPILIIGSQGTGKDLLVDYIHKNSTFNEKSLLKAQCVLFQENNFVQELVGYDRETQTEFVGLLNQAEDTTLYFSDVDKLSIPHQQFLLSILKQKFFHKAYLNNNHELKCRCLFSITGYPKILIKNHELDEDFYNFLQPSQINLPQLVDRKDDILPLLNYFTGIHNIDEITPDALQLLIDYHWPGNIRELQNVVEITASQITNSIIRKEFLPDTINNPFLVDSGNLTKLEVAEKRIILTTLKENKYNKKRTAEILDISRKTLYNKLEHYEIKLSDLL